LAWGECNSCERPFWGNMYLSDLIWLSVDIMGEGEGEEWWTTDETYIPVPVSWLN